MQKSGKLVSLTFRHYMSEKVGGVGCGAFDEQTHTSEGERERLLPGKQQGGNERTPLRTERGEKEIRDFEPACSRGRVRKVP